MKKILFLCTGNYYRSRFAEIYFNFVAKKRNLDWLSFSRGFDVSNLDNLGFISNHTKKELKKLNIPLPNNPAPPVLLTMNDFEGVAKVIVLNEREHRLFIQQFFPEWENKVVFWNISDLYEESSSESLRKLKSKLDQLLEEIEKTLILKTEVTQ